MKKYFAFEGKSSRSEYWGVNIIGSMSIVLASVIGAVIMTDASAMAPVIGGLVLLFVAILAAWACIATSVRRCREAGITPWWVLGNFVPYIGIVVFIVIGVLGPKQQITSEV
jgi:uncharacterized membrane protein YhaH (DUF805 family)